MDKYDLAYQKYSTSDAPIDKYDAAYQQYSKPSPAYDEGRQSNSSLQGLVAAVNGPLMGFGDEVLGALGAPLKSLVNGQSVGDNYRELRDGYRGMIDARTEDAPVTTALTQLATSAPMIAMNPLGKAAGAVKAMVPGLKGAQSATQVAGVGQRTAQAAASGFGYGTVQGVGDSTSGDFGDVLKDGVANGATSAAFGAAGMPVLSAMGAVGGNVAQRISKTSAYEAAKLKVAEALSRDARGTTFQTGQSNPINQVSARLGKLGDEATVADAGGQNTRQLLDTLATLPGRTKDAAEQLIHSRQAGRAGRLITAAEDGLSTQGQRLSPHIDQWITQRERDAAPLYNQLRKTTVNPSAQLQSIVASADELGAVGLGREMAAARQMPFTLDIRPGASRNGLTNMPNSNGWTMNDLDHVKQGLDQKIAKQWDATEGKLTPLGLAYQDLKNKFVKELDTATTDPKSGVSLYKSARDAFAGPSALVDAAQLGRGALSKDGATIKNMVGDLSTSEQQAFRLGAYESLRNKLGREAGQTEILKMWKEPATREKLAAVFGDELRFRSFASNVAKESRLKGLESVGRGSQTAARQFGAGDLDVGALTQAGGAMAAAKTGNFMGALAAAKDGWSRVATPQPVRDEMGSLLLSKGLLASDNVSGLAEAMNKLNSGTHRMHSAWGHPVL